MKRDLYEVSYIVMVVGLCAFVFGVAWSLAAIEGWGWYGAIVATVGFCAVTVAALIRIFVLDDDSGTVPGTIVVKGLADMSEREREKWIAERVGLDDSTAREVARKYNDLWRYVRDSRGQEPKGEPS